MSVTTTHPSYDKLKPQWARLRDVIAGRDAMLAKARLIGGMTGRGSLFAASAWQQEEYIQRLSGMDEVAYYRYCEAAQFFNATGRAVDALAGMVMAKDPDTELPAPLDAYADDITLDGTSLREFAQNIITEEISLTRVGVMVDYHAGIPSGLTRGDAERLNIRPFLRHYTGESILNWRVSAVNGAQVLTMVVLAEEMEQQKDEFSAECVTVYRVLDLTEQGYRVRLMNDKSELISETFPLMNGRPMGFIPFVIVGGNKARKPLLIDLADTNIGHYRNSAQFERGLGFTGSPVPVVSGVTLEPGQSLNIGSMSAWVFPDPAASAEYLEFKGDGLKSNVEAMKDKEQRMAILGARMLVEEKRTAEASDTVSMRTAGERSLLAAVANDVSDAMTRALRWMAEWSGVSTDGIVFKLNTDYGAARMTPQMLTALGNEVRSGQMPLEVYFDNLKRGEIANGEFEDYEAKLDTQAPQMDAPTAESPPARGGMAGLRNLLGL